jgi:DNA primase
VQKEGKSSVDTFRANRFDKTEVGAMVDTLLQSELNTNAILRYYRTVASCLDATFSGVPIMAATYPHGPHKPAVYVSHPSIPRPAGIETIAVTTSRGTHSYYTLSRATIDWFVQDGAVEFLSWSPTPRDPTKAALGRILIEPHARASEAALPDACRAVLSVLGSHSMQGAITLSGTVGAQIRIPLSNAPAYPDLRSWLHAIANETAARYPDLISVAPKTERGDRFYLSVSTNAVGRLSMLPYSLRASEALDVVLPIRVSDLGRTANGDVTAANIGEYLDRNGDIFAAELKRIGDQRLPSSPRAFLRASADAREGEPRGYVIAAAIQLLADGKPKTADELLAAGLQAGLLTKSTTRKYIYHSLVAYIGRVRGRGRAPAIVQDQDRRFRLNHPVDDWPQMVPSAVAPSSEVRQLIDRLRQTAVGSDPESFELAVCAAFERLGFMATHVGGFAAPDGYIDAPLGRLAYRVMLECKTAKPGGVVNDANVAEAAKYREQYGATCCVLIGPAFRDETAIDTELRTHNVSLWTVDDLAGALENGCDPFELRPVFDAGRAADKLNELLWSCMHGVNNHVRVACAYLVEEGWKAQQMAAREVAPTEAPLLTVDAGMLLLDERLEREGCTQGCTRAEVEEAFDWLTSPRVSLGVRLEGSVRAIVIRRAL